MGYTNTELLQGCFTQEMVDLFLDLHGYTKASFDQEKPSVVSQLILSIVMDEQADAAQQQALMDIKMGLLRMIEDHIEKQGDEPDPRYE
ncbi:MAG: hypothetical protein SOS22_08080 [Absicoccus sp.]|uniref:Uncharacterized protein n=1 Tax=Absicoccus intestinalis TaxID=2926319 RepID=A0ABU4WN85_9FIRM|nr:MULTISPECIES: hypothetical protein [unclassified Absicoccus]MDX8416995.1 hypothetical protein [Absicoccus sp. CLA-KB-P134]MDY3036157.1 hypothetical protein [Absicoccus sp.]